MVKVDLLVVVRHVLHVVVELTDERRMCGGSTVCLAVGNQSTCLDEVVLHSFAPLHGENASIDLGERSGDRQGTNNSISAPMMLIFSFSS